MKIDTIALYVVAGLACLIGLAYFAALVFGIIETGGMLLPAAIVYVAVVALVIVVIRQRLANREDDYYDRIEK